jgi:hypothetical protein
MDCGPMVHAKDAYVAGNIAGLPESMRKVLTRGINRSPRDGK